MKFFFRYYLHKIKMGKKDGVGGSLGRQLVKNQKVHREVSYILDFGKGKLIPIMIHTSLKDFCRLDFRYDNSYLFCNL